MVYLQLQPIVLKIGSQINSVNVFQRYHIWDHARIYPKFKFLLKEDTVYPSI